MGTARTFYLGNRLWWSGALLIAPIVGAIGASPGIGILAAAVLILPTALIFDTDRKWWSDEVREISEDKARSRIEVRLLTLWAAAGLGLGLVIAYIMS